MLAESELKLIAGISVLSSKPCHKSLRAKSPSKADLLVPIQRKSVNAPSLRPAAHHVRNKSAGESVIAEDEKLSKFEPQPQLSEFSSVMVGI